MVVLSVVFIVTAAALFCVSRILKQKQAQAAYDLSQKLKAAAKEQESVNTGAEAPGQETCEDSSWDLMWDEAEDQIDEDFYRLLRTASGVFRGFALVLLIGALAVLAVSVF